MDELLKQAISQGQDLIVTLAMFFLLWILAAAKRLVTLNASEVAEEALAEKTKNVLSLIAGMVLRTVEAEWQAYVKDLKDVQNGKLTDEQKVTSNERVLEAVAKALPIDVIRFCESQQINLTTLITSEIETAINRRKQG